MIKFQQLNAFKAVYELGTMMAASAHIHVTQPAISRLVASLEHQLGFALFQRIRGRLVPTDKGTAFYLEVSKAFSALEHLEHSARDIAEQHHGSLHITAFPMLSNSFLPAILGRLMRETPGLKASLKSYRSEEVLRRTEIQSCDLGFADTEITSPSVTAIPVWGDCVCIVPAGSELAAMPSLTPADLSGMPFIRYENSDSAQQALDRALAQAGIHSLDVVEVSFASVAASLVAEGLGVAVVDPFTARHAQQCGLNIVIREFRPCIPYRFQILYPAFRPNSDLARAFVDSLFSQAEAVGISLRHEKNGSL
ncbi:LysR substrate-binding domain-containing protein [uncultured Oceanisphaera sp.]|uniref:LysR substrate-binding domain-containing protein n=1 Tax=uncultured Oceanisphaera sp. TaxID=353858 RepID=UPI00262910F7|nr:LysR substrate-binding domain-containing protein [uncultured Oceanisphaera sp.]